MVTDDAIWFGCTACGQCCNSPPRLSLPEMFRFQDVFVGCLAASRLSARGDAARGALLDRLALRVSGPAASTHLALTPQGYGYEVQTGCPALANDGACTLHAQGKPTQCDTVPLDAFAANSEQPGVLRERMRDPLFTSAECISRERRADAVALTQNGRVLDPGYVHSLEQRRHAIEEDLRIWGGAVLRHMGPQVEAVPATGFLALPFSPVLLVIAGVSAACRDRVLEFIAAQTALIEQNLHQAAQRRRAEDLPMTRRLRSWTENYRALRRILAEPPGAWAPQPLARQREIWLGCA